MPLRLCAARQVPGPATSFSYRFVKRALDVLCSSAALVAGAPVAAAIAAAIKLTSAGPVFFTQERVGENGRRFTIYKFRTLPVLPKYESDNRWSDVAPSEAGALGRLLRRLGIDEWPQFWNVLRGDMSVVGPRPERLPFAKRFGKKLPGYSYRERLKPGITGWAQIHGSRGDCDIADRLEYDLYYLRNWSVALDLKILFLTPLRLLAFKKGDSQPLFRSLTVAAPLLNQYVSEAEPRP